MRARKDGGVVQDTRPARPGAAAPLYDRDFALWIGEQVRLLEAGEWAALDVPNLVEELQGLTKRDERALGSQLQRVMLHLLKRRHQPERASRSWADSIRHGRNEIEDILDQSPSLRRRLPDLMRKHYPRAVADAASQTGLPDKTFPDESPFSLAEILGEHPDEGDEAGGAPSAAA